MEKLRIVVTGFIGLYPSGGVTWDYIQYLLGFHLLGHDVYYLEDTMQYSNYQTAGRSWDDSTDSINYLKEVMQKFGFQEKWAYRDVASGNCFGLSLQEVLEVCRTADLFINISASTYLREEYLKIPKRVLIDSDPMFTQVQDWDDKNPKESFDKIRNVYSNYNYLFTFGENINELECRIPKFDLQWEVTRQPICLKYWNSTRELSESNGFTTVMNWSTRSKMKYLQEEWGQKDVEFERFVEIPKLFNGARFTLIVADSSKKMNSYKLKEAGWQLFNPLEAIKNTDQYQNFIEKSAGEFSVAKETYVKSKSGWFSCRSACYLATGRPVVTQDTGWSKNIPSGEGLFAFQNQETAIQALSEVSKNINKHSKAAREIAVQYFDSEKVLGRLISKL